jgi:hypothetical protein
MCLYEISIYHFTTNEHKTGMSYIHVGVYNYASHQFTKPFRLSHYISKPFPLALASIPFLLPLYPHLLGHFSFMVFQYIVLFCFHIWKFLSIFFYAVMYHCQVIVIVIYVNFVYKPCYCPFGSQVSSGSIVSDYGLDNQVIGVRSPAGAKDFFSILCV